MRLAKTTLVLIVMFLTILSIPTLAAPIFRPTVAEDGHGIQPSSAIGADVYALANSIWLTGHEDRIMPTSEGPDVGALADFNDWLAFIMFNTDATSYDVVVLGALTCCPAAITFGPVIPGEVFKLFALNPNGRLDVSGTDQWYVEQIYPQPCDTVPEPSTWGFALIGLGLLWAWRVMKRCAVLWGPGAQNGAKEQI